MYFCIDMKCFFASVECAERGLDPMKTALVVADASRGKGALCLAISPYLKSLGIPSRTRLYEMPSNISYIVARPRMQKYIDYAVMIHRIFLKYFDSEDIHTYSIDEAFLKIDSYRTLYPDDRELAKQIIEDIHQQLGILAACGIGDNIFLSKLALDLKAKHAKDSIYYLSKDQFYEEVWSMRQLDEIWQIGKGIQRRLHRLGLFTLKDVAFTNPRVLTDEFGVIGLDLYEHAWGNDDTQISDIQAYRPASKSLSRRQILFEDYSKEDVWIPLVEMLYLLCMDLFRQGLGCLHVSFFMCFSASEDGYKKSFTLDTHTNNYFIIKKYLEKYYQQAPRQLYRSLGISVYGLAIQSLWQNTLFFLPDEKYEALCEAILEIWKKYGKNKLVIGTALEKKSTIYQRNQQIGGHNRD